MPPKIKIKKEDILDAAVELIRTNGAAALNARALAASLGVSTQPVFSHYRTMEDLKQDVMAAANERYQSFLKHAMENPDYPTYKASGLGYIRFAKEETELFKLLFMRDRSGETIDKNMDEIQPLLTLIQQKTGLSEEEAYLFHLEMWVYVHGIATMIATSYLPWDWEIIDQMMTDVFEGLKKQFLRKDTE